ncbi:MAG: hypothetical protein AB8H12_17615 [Lewinella sp.]
MFLALILLVALVGMISSVPRILGYVFVVAKEADQVASTHFAPASAPENAVRQ